MPRVLDVLSAGKEYGRICGRYAKMIPPGRVRHFAYPSWADIEWSVMARPTTTPLLIVSPVAELPAQRPIHPPSLGQRERRYLLFPERMPTAALPARVSQLNIRDPRRLHLAGAKNRQEAQGVIGRAIRGLAEPAEPRIVDAWWEGDDLIVLSPEFRRLRIPLEKLSHVIGREAKAVGVFEIDADGSFVHWPHADVHLGWTQFVRMIDPVEALAAKAAHRDFDGKYGAAIRRVREEAGLRQSDIPGLTARQVGRIEKGECRATHAALSKLAAAHGETVSQYLDRLAGKLE